MVSNREQIFLSPGQVAKRAGVSRATVSRALMAGELLGIRDNSGRWKVAEGDVQNWRAKPGTAHDLLMISDHEQENQKLREQISGLHEQLHEAELRYVRLEASSTIAAQMTEQQIAELRRDRDRWHELATRPVPTLIERIRNVFSPKSEGA